MCGLEQNISNDHVYESATHDWAAMDGDAFWNKNENLRARSPISKMQRKQQCGLLISDGV